VLPGCVVVLDVGKTLTKLSLFAEEGQLIVQRSYQNRVVEFEGRHWLDTEGIDRWVRQTLQEFTQLRSIAAIVPIGHGAAAGLIRDDALVCPIPDYEDIVEPALRTEYDAQRDPFSATGSPALPAGLNLGVQLYRLERHVPRLWENGTMIVPWAQFWAWKLCDVAACEVSSLGSHTDLWLPEEGRPSSMARKLGWAERLAARRPANSVLGPVDPRYAITTGLSANTLVYCGAHDSNAALHAVRAYPQVANREATVISTGTWFVAMRVPGPSAKIDLAALPETRDCLVNVDVTGRPVPSARFMGGREIDLLGGLDAGNDCDILRTLRSVLRAGAMALPGRISGVGPFPKAPGAWIAEPHNGPLRAAAVALYAVLMVDTSLDLIGGHELLIVEGRFALSELFVRALATIRSSDKVLVNRESGGGATFGALRLVDDRLPVVGSLERVAPLDIDLSAYKSRWLTAVSRGETRQ